MNGPSAFTHGSPPGPRPAFSIDTKNITEAKTTLDTKSVVSISAENENEKDPSTDASTTQRTRVPISGDNTPGVIRRLAITKSFAQGDFVLNELEGAEACAGAAVLEAAPGSVGNVAALTGTHLVHALKLPVVAYFTAPQLASSARVLRGQPAHPLRVHGDSRLVVFVSETPLPPSLLVPFVDHILAWAARHSAPHVFTLEAEPETEYVADDGTRVSLKSKNRARNQSPFPSQPFPRGIHMLDPLGQPSDDESDSDDESESDFSESDCDDADGCSSDGPGKDRFLTTSTSTALVLAALDFKALRSGTVSGVAGALLAHASVLTSPDVTALLVRASPAYPDGLAAARIVRALGTMVEHLEGSEDTTKMERHALRSKRAFIKRRRKETKVEEEQTRMRRLRRSADAPMNMYM